MTSTRSRVAQLPTIDYCGQMTAPLTAVTAATGALGIRPCYLQVSHNEYHELVHDRPWTVSVQVDDVSDADRLADHYGLAADDGEGTNYTREGVAVLDGIGEVQVRIYTGRPTDGGGLAAAEVESARLAHQSAEANS